MQLDVMNGEEGLTNMPTTKNDLGYLKELLQKFSSSGLSMVEMVIASLLILSLAVLVARAGGMKGLPNSMKNIRDFTTGIRDSLNQLSNQMADSTYRQAEAGPSSPRPTTTATRNGPELKS